VFHLGQPLARAPGRAGGPKALEQMLYLVSILDGNGVEFAHVAAFILRLPH